MEKKDIKLLITGAIALFLACFLGIITIALFAIKIGGKAMDMTGRVLSVRLQNRSRALAIN